MIDIKGIFGHKLQQLRTEAGMTQQELGDKLSYSDKSISKWERGEAIPDAAVLKKISTIFSVSLDYLLTDGQAAPAEEAREDSEPDYRNIARVVLVGIWTLAVAAFVLLWIFGIFYWQTVFFALPVSLITLLVFNNIWHMKLNNVLISVGLAVTLFAMLYFIFLSDNLWQLFLIVPPAVFVIIFAFRVKTHKKSGYSTGSRVKSKQE